MNCIKSFFSIPFFFLLLLSTGLRAQKTMEVDGLSESDDTVMVVRTNSNAMFRDVIGLGVYSNNAPGRGIGGYFNAGSTGIWAESDGTGLFAIGKNGFGLRAENELGSAAYFKGGADRFDITLGGKSYGGSVGNDEGVIGVNGASGDLWLISNDNILLQLDDNDDEPGELIIANGAGGSAIRIFENGTIRSLALAGGGEGPLVADNNGNIIKTSMEQKIKSITPGSIKVSDIVAGGGFYKYRASFREKVQGFAPIELPHGSTLDSIVIVYNDESSIITLEMCFKKVVMHGGPGRYDEVISQCANSTTSSDKIKERTLVIGEIIDNSGFFHYAIEFLGVSSGISTLIDFTQVYGIRLYYH